MSPTVDALELSPFIYSRARSVQDRLRKAEEFEREALRGYIIELHKDRPTAREQSRQIALDVKFGSTRRKVLLRLLPSDYRKAVHWHDTDLEVTLDAVIDKRGHIWSVARLFDLKPLDKSAAGPNLFGSGDSDAGST